MDSAEIRTVAVLGTGLIGGSVLRRLHDAGLDATGWDPDPATPAVDTQLRFADSAEQAVAGRDLVVLAGPLSTLTATMDKVAPHVPAGAIVTDVGSTKSDIAGYASRTALGDRFVPGHPMAGSQFGGIRASHAAMFDGATWVLCPPPGWAPGRLRPLIALLTGTLGAQVTCMSPAAHDSAVALSSHVPHVLAGGLAGAVGGSPDAAAVLGLAAGSFVDGTRVAATNPDRTVDMLSSNREALTVQWRAVREQMDAIVDAVRADDVDRLKELFGAAAALRARLDDRAVETTRHRFGHDADPGAELEFLCGTGSAGGQIVECRDEGEAVIYTLESRTPAVETGDETAR